MNLSRRALLPAVAAVFAGASVRAATQAPTRGVPHNGNEILFDVLFGGAHIGFHDITFAASDGGALTVRTRIDVAVSMLNIPLFYYRHTSTETYAGSRLIGFVGETDDDGDRFNVHGEAVSDGFRAFSVKGPVMAPADILVASYWNPEILARKTLLDPQKGRIREQMVKHVEQITISVLGRSRKATLYRVEGIADGDIYYDETGEWVGARLVRRGTNVTYRRRA